MAEPLKGLRAIEFGQLLAGPFTGTLLGDFGADVIKIEAPGAGDAMRDWGRLRHNDRSLWWSILARNKRSVALNLREPEGQRIAAELAATADIVLENFRPGNDGEVGPRARGRARPQPARDLRPRVRLRPDRALRAPARASPPRARRSPACATSTATRTRRRRARASRFGDTLAAQSAFQGILLALYARERGAEGQVVDAGIVDACFAMSESSTLEYEKTGFVREPTGPRLPRIAPSNVYLSSDEQVGRDRGQPRHAVAAAGDDHGPAGAGGGRALRHPPRARRARGPARRDHRRVRRAAHGGRSSTRSSTRAASSARPSTRRRTSTRTRTSASASCSWSTRTRSTGT